MNFILKPRAGGKTHDIVAAVGNDPTATLIVPTAPMVARLRASYPDLKCEVCSWERRAIVMGKIGTVAIDNIDMIIDMELGYRTNRFDVIVSATGIFEPTEPSKP